MLQPAVSASFALPPQPSHCGCRGTLLHSNGLLSLLSMADPLSKNAAEWPPCADPFEPRCNRALHPHYRRRLKKTKRELSELPGPILAFDLRRLSTPRGPLPKWTAGTRPLVIWPWPSLAFKLPYSNYILLFLLIIPSFSYFNPNPSKLWSF